MLNWSTIKTAASRMIASIALVYLLIHVLPVFKEWKEDFCCNKGRSTDFHNCLVEKFPPGSSYWELDAFLLKKGISKISVEKLETGETKFVYIWIPKIRLVPYGLNVVGSYNEDFEVIEVGVPSAK